MKIKYRLNQLRKERDSLSDFLRSNAIMTRPMVIKLCNQISFINSKMEAIEKIPLSKANEEHIEWTVEVNSKINKEVNSTKKLKRKSKTELVTVPSTWRRF